jgi:hypothetical protein
MDGLPDREGGPMKDLLRYDINVRIAGKVWHFRELFDIEGTADNDRAIASDLYVRGIRQTHRIYRELRNIFQQEMQGQVLVEEDEIARSKG